MGESAIIQISFSLSVGLGVGYDKTFKELVFHLPFSFISICFKKKTDSNKWFEIIK